MVADSRPGGGPNESIDNFPSQVKPIVDLAVKCDMARAITIDLVDDDGYMYGGDRDPARKA